MPNICCGVQQQTMLRKYQKILSFPDPLDKMSARVSPKELVCCRTISIHSCKDNVMSNLVQVQIDCRARDKRNCGLMMVTQLKSGLQSLVVMLSLPTHHSFPSALLKVLIPTFNSHADWYCVTTQPDPAAYVNPDECVAIEPNGLPLEGLLAQSLDCDWYMRLDGGVVLTFLCSTCARPRDHSRPAFRIA